MITSENVNEIAKAISNLQGSMGPAKKDRVNPFFKSNYADLPSIWNAIRDGLHENGLCVVQDAVTLDIGVSIYTRVIHVSGQFIEFGPLVVPVPKSDAQAVGSAISYGKRYALGAALGIVSEVDDDGNRATKSVASAPPKKVAPLKKIDLDAWYSEMESKFKGIDVIAYVEESSKRMQKSEQDTVNFLGSLSIDKLKESLERWQRQKDDATKDTN